jgi:hypothetical protein
MEPSDIIRRNNEVVIAASRVASARSTNPSFTPVTVNSITAVSTMTFASSDDKLVFDDGMRYLNYSATGIPAVSLYPTFAVDRLALGEGPIVYPRPLDLPSRITSLTVTRTQVSPTYAFRMAWYGGFRATSYTFTRNAVSINSYAYANDLTPALTLQTIIFNNNAVTLFPGDILNVKAITADGFTSASYTVPPLATVPTSITTSDITISGFVIHWMGNQGAISYQYSITSNNRAINTAMLTTPPPFLDNGRLTSSVTYYGLSSSTIYTVTIQAINEIGIPTDFPPVVVTTLDASPPTKPAITSVTNLTTTSFDLEWTGGVGALSYTFTRNGVYMSPSTDDSLYDKKVKFTNLLPDLLNGEQIVVIATNTLGSTYSLPYTLLLPPTKPDNLTVVNQSAAGFTLTWTGAIGATSYTFSRNGSPITPTTNDSLVSRMVIFTGLNLLEGDSIVITAFNNFPTGTSSLPFILALPPTRPSLTCSAITPQSFSLTWTGGTNATSYTFFRSNTAIIPSTPVSPPYSGSSGVTFTLLSPDLINGEEIVVVATNAIGSTRSYHFELNIAPTAPTNISVSNVTLRGFNLSWAGAFSTTSYTYTIYGYASPYTVAAGKITLNNALTSQNITIANLDADLVNGYQIVITATNSLGSTSSSRFTLAMPPTKPFGLVVSNITTLNTATPATTGGFTLTWSGGVGALSYTYTRNGVNITPSTDSSLNSSPSVTFTNLSPDSFYGNQIVVIATNTTGSTPSFPIMINMAPTEPVNLLVSNLTLTGFDLNWDGGYGATVYNFRRNGVNITPAAGKDNSLSTQSVTFSSITPDFVHGDQIVVIATNGIVGSTPSAPFTLAMLPTKPTNLSTSFSSSSLTLTWSGGVGALSYTFMKNGNLIFPTTISPTSQSATFSGLLPEFSYGDQIVIIASNTVGSTYSDPTFPNQAPSSPTDIHITNLTSTGFRMNWEGGFGATSYTYTRKRTSTSDFALVPLTDNSLVSKSVVFSFNTDTFLSGDQIVLMAMNASGQISSTVNLTMPPTKPVLSASLLSSSVNGFGITWTGGTNAMSYTFSRNGLPITPSSISLASNPKSATFTNLSPNLIPQEQIIVTATNVGGSTSSDVFLLPLPPTAATDIAVSNLTNLGVKLSWSGVIGATGFTYSQNGTQLTSVFDQTNTSVTLSGTFASGDTIIITALNSAGSTPSVPVALLLPPTKPQITSSTLNSVSGFTLQWTGGVGATSYSFTRNGVSISPSIDNSLTPLPHATFTNLSPDLRFGENIVVTATNTGGSSSSLPIIFNTLPPTNITDILLSNMTPTGFYIIWSGGLGATSYSFTRIRAGATNATLIATTSSLHFATFSGLSLQDGDQIVITGTSAASVGVSSSPVTLSIQPTKPISLSATSISSSAFNLSWLGGAGTLTYTFTRNGYPITPSTDNSLSTQSVTFTNLSPLSYNGDQVVIIASNNSGSTYSSPVSLNMKPAPPMNLSFVKNGGAYTLSWEEANGATSYTFTRQIGGPGTEFTLTPDTDNSLLSQYVVFAEQSPQFGNDDIIKIEATNASGTTSSSIVINLLPGTPDLITVKSFTATSFILSWMSLPGAEWYNFMLNDSAIIPSVNNSLTQSPTVTFQTSASLVPTDKITIIAGNMYGTSTVTFTYGQIPTIVSGTNIVKVGSAVTSFRVNWSGGLNAATFGANIFSLSGMVGFTLLNNTSMDFTSLQGVTNSVDVSIFAITPSRVRLSSPNKVTITASTATTTLSPL